MINATQQDSAGFELARESGGAPRRGFHDFPVGHDTIVGTDGRDTLVGTAGDDTLDGGGGRDQMSGGLGNDTYIVGNFLDVVIEDVNAGVDTVLSSVGYTAPSNVENLTLTGAADISARGNALNNVLTGNAGNNALNGLAGADTMLGGMGNDTYFVDSLRDRVLENPGEGVDDIHSTVRYVLPGNVENLTLVGSADIDGIGNSLANLLTGNAGNNRLSGISGTDTMAGGFGNDSYVVNDTGDQVIEAVGQGTDTVYSAVSYTLGANVENLTLIHAAALSGTGNSLDNLITGNAGRNFLVGLEGNDTLLGGDEDDTIKGGEGDDVLSGGGGADYLYGDHGDDSLNGGDGNDYFGLNDQGSDTVDGGTGYDFLSADFSESPVALNLTLGMTSPGGMQVTNVERVWMYFGNQADYFNSGTGTDVIVFAEGGDDTLVGAGGGDELFGDDGNDSLTGAGGIDDLDGGSGADWLDGGAGHDILYGGDGIDSLMGGEGNDYLSGGFGGDWLDGGAGADIIWCESFVFTWDKAPDTVALNSFIGSDRVIGFESGIDKLMVSAASIPVGDGDLGLEGATTRAAPGGFDTSAELVIFSSNITGPIDAGSAAAAIGSANSAYSAGQTALFVVDNGADSAVFYFKSAGADALVSASELTLLATLSGTPATDVGDYLLGA